MKTRETTPGKTYSVHTSSGCTVNDKSGWSKTIDAPDGYFTAHAGEVTIDGDDAADVREVFKLAPQQRLTLLGVLGGGVPAWLLKYAECVTVNDVKAVNAAYQSDLTADMEWLYHLPLLEDGHQMFDGAAQIVGWDCALPALTNGEYMFRRSPLVNFKSKLPKLTNVNGMFSMSKITTWDITLPALTTGQLMFYNTPLVYFRGGLPEMKSGINMFWQAKLTEFHGELPKLSWGEAMFRNCPLTRFESSLPKLSNGSNMFPNGRLNKVSALNVLNSIPAFTSGSHPLTIGIHVDHKTDDEVLAAIANAESKGWTLTVQWNGTPTAQASVTYGLRKPPIYAKVGEQEMPDGTTERVLDWGHYVTDPSGYEEFRSEEEAREYFGLPEEPLTNN